jgi:hypothetical protein
MRFHCRDQTVYFGAEFLVKNRKQFKWFSYCWLNEQTSDYGMGCSTYLYF